MSFKIGCLDRVCKAGNLILVVAYAETVDEQAVIFRIKFSLFSKQVGYIDKGSVMFHTRITLFHIYVELLPESAVSRH